MLFLNFFNRVMKLKPFESEHKPLCHGCHLVNIAFILFLLFLFWSPCKHLYKGNYFEKNIGADTFRINLIY